MKLIQKFGAERRIFDIFDEATIQIELRGTLVLYAGDQKDQKHNTLELNFVIISVKRLGNLLDFGQLFKAFGSN